MRMNLLSQLNEFAAEPAGSALVVGLIFGVVAAILMTAILWPEPKDVPKPKKPFDEQKGYGFDE